MKRTLPVLLLLLFIVFTCAQSGYSQELRIVEEEKLRELEEEIPLDQQIFFDGGVWLRFEYGNIHDEVKQRTWRNYDARLWLNFTIEDVHQFYARFRLDFLDFNEGDAFDGDHFDVDGPNLDQAFWRMNVSNCLKKFGKPLPLDLDLSFRVGRQFMYLGRGIAYSRVDEGFEFLLENYDFSWKVIASRTKHHEDDFDTSRPNSNRTDRLFLGSQLTYKGLRKHYPYVFVLIQEDENREDPNVPGQDFDYNSQYYGLGMHGQVIPNLRYWGEFIFQTGTTFGSFSTLDRDDIDSQALDVGLEYYFQLPCKPKLSFEYAWAEGDQDRASVTQTMFGNTPGTIDTQFLSFGYINTGYSFAPLFSNIQFARFGGACRPLATVHDIFEKMEVGVNFFIYRKDEKRGAISDFRADVPSKQLGTELDVYLNWRILSDVALGVNYGVFYPGDAFTESDQRTFMLATVTYSF
jgi:hypothetical protein